MCLSIKILRITGLDSSVKYGLEHTFYTSSTSSYAGSCFGKTVIQSLWSMNGCTCMCVLQQSLHTTMLKHSSPHSSCSKITEHALHQNTHIHTPTVPTDIWHTLTSHSAFEWHWWCEVFILQLAGKELRTEGQSQSTVVKAPGTAGKIFKEDQRKITFASLSYKAVIYPLGFFQHALYYITAVRCLIKILSGRKIRSLRRGCGAMGWM